MADRLYRVRVDIYEAATRYAYPVVTHVFTGRSPEEAWRYHDAHVQADAFLRECSARGSYRGEVRCKARVSEGWSRS